VNSAKGPVSRILSCAVIPLDAALPRTFISDLPGGFGNSQSRLNASGRCAAPPDSSRALPSLFGLAPCGVYLDPDPYGPSGALLPHHFTLTPALEFSATASEPGKPGQLGYCVSREALQPDPKNRGGVAEAVSFLWHWPSVGFEAHVPDVIRHTALRSSDFPPPVGFACANPPGSDRPVLLPVASLAQSPVGEIGRPLPRLDLRYFERALLGPLEIVFNKAIYPKSRDTLRPQLSVQIGMQLERGSRTAPHH